MQNVDFSRQVKKTAPMPGTRESGEHANRCYFFALVVSLLFFSGGVYAGLQLHRIQHIEENLVRYPDQEQKTESSSEHGSSSFSNIASGSQDEEGKYIIYAGAHDGRKAARLAGELNGLPGLQRVQALPCKNMDEDPSERPTVFRTASSKGDELQDVYAGCFSGKDEGNRILEEIRRSSVPGAAEARLFMIR